METKRDLRSRGHWAIERSIGIGASAGRVFALISDLRQWEQWNLNGRNDPKIQRTYGGSLSGTGATLTWSGSRSGAGEMEITSARPDEEVVVVVRFARPFKVTNLNRFALTPDAEGTRVTWSMQGPKPLLVKILGVAFDMERPLGKHFDAGLANLKSLAEDSSRTGATASR